MWSLTEPASGLTNKVTMPSDGIVNIDKPEGVKINTFINDTREALHHIHVKEGDVVSFEITNMSGSDAKVAVEFAGTTSYLTVPMTEKGKDMTEAMNLFTGGGGMGMGGALGGGLGAGLLGGVLGGALLGNNGALGSNRGGQTWATPTDVQIAVSDSAIQTALGDIKASVPLAEAQVQLALAGQSASITSTIVNGNAANIAALALSENVLLNGLNAQNISTQKGFSELNTAVVTSAAANALATERAAYVVTQAVSNDGEKTRALIQSIDKTNDSRLITNLSNEVTELRGDRRLAEATGNITISNNNTAVATAQQQQSQQQFQILANLNAQLQSLNNDIQAVRQSSVVFNSGTQVASGNQSAATTRVA